MNILSYSSLFQLVRRPALVYQTVAKSASPRLYQPTMYSGPNLSALFICWKTPPSTMFTVALTPILFSMPAIAWQISVSETYLPFWVVIGTGVLKS